MLSDVGSVIMTLLSTGPTEEKESQTEPGQFGPFYLQELINVGGMAEIWLATDSHGEVSALRKLKDNSFLNFTSKKRFIRGCNILSQIHAHEGIITYKQHGKINGIPYLLMDYQESSNLKLLLSRSDEILHEFVGNIIIDMAEALEHIHDCGFMHLDFKPENILATRNGSVRLVDFDLALPRPEKPKKMSENPGTPSYMAPEQLMRKPFDHRADHFAFGVTAYELLTFRKPFIGDTPKEILIKQLGSETSLVSPREINPDIPAALDKVIMKCLSRRMDDRYPYTSVLIRDLKAALYVQP